MQTNQMAWYQSKLRELLSPDEVKLIMTKSNLRGVYEIATTWLWIAFAFALVGFMPNVLTIIIALFMIGGKQLACAIIMHDCSHDAVFTSRQANQVIGNWLGAYPIFHNMEQYRPYHREHHIYTGLDNDPDLSLTKGYPTTVVSMFRKLLRDLLGATGIKAQLGVIAMHLGIIRYNLGGVVERVKQEGNRNERINHAIKNLAGPVVANFLLFATLCLVGQPKLYLLWIGALLTTYNFCLRVRSIAEHSVVDERQNPERNTRTTYANFLERLLFAPHYVNYHAEHHLCMGAPPYNLPLMHRLLYSKGYYNNAILERNYWKIVKKAVTIPIL